MSPSVVLVAAVAANGIIGDRGRMPWRLATDLQRFKALTLGKPVVMGRLTFESLGKPLAGRTNIVVSGRAVASPEVEVVTSFAAALVVAGEAARATGAGEIIIMGGRAIYEAAMPVADRLCITHVEVAPSGDVSFPPIDPDVWRPTHREPVPAGPRDDYPTEFVVYERIAAPSGG